MYWLGLISGIVITFLGLFTWLKIDSFIEKRKGKKYIKKYIKRGLYISEFTRSNGYGKKTDYTVHAEVGLVERTKTKIKIEVINLRTSISSDEIAKKQVTDIIEGWRDIDDTEIEWFEPHPGDVRGEKIDNILND